MRDYSQVGATIFLVSVAVMFILDRIFR